MLANLSERELTIWVAAFYEGEGSITCGSSNRCFQLTLQFAQKDLEPLLTVMDWLDSLGVKYNKYQTQPDGCHRIMVRHYPHVQVVVDKLWDYVSARRRGQMDDAVEDFLDNSVKYGTKPDNRKRVR